MLRIGFWRAHGLDDRWSETPALAGLSLEAHAKYVLGEAVHFEFFAHPDELVASDVDVAAISSVTGVWPFALDAIAQCKAAGKRVVVGGAHISAAPWSLPPEADLAVIGEGEALFTGALGRMLDGHALPRELGDARPLNLDNATWLPVAALAEGRSLAAVASRGCPYRCSFCSASRFWRGVRRFSPQYIASWIAERVGSFEQISFHDLMAAADVQWLTELAEALEPVGLGEKFRISLMSGRTNLVTPKLCQALKRLGVQLIGVGMESCSPPVLAKLKPHCTVEDHERAVRLCYEHEILLSSSFILGTPGESAHDLQATYDFIARWQGRYFRQGGIFVLTPYPGTPWWDYAMECGVLTEPVDWTRFRSCVGTLDWDWDAPLYLNEATMRRGETKRWQQAISRMCGERREDLMTPEGLRDEPR